MSKGKLLISRIVTFIGVVGAVGSFSVVIHSAITGQGIQIEFLLGGILLTLGALTRLFPSLRGDSDKHEHE